MTKKPLIAALCAMLPVFVFEARAESLAPLSVPPVLLVMQGDAAMTVKNDEAVVVFEAESRQPDASSATADVTARGNAALAALKTFGAVLDVETTGLSTNPVRTRAKEGEVSQIGAWEARETVRVTVKDAEKVSDVLAAVAPHMNFEGITFRVSDAARRAQRDELLKRAVADALRQAKTAAEALGQNPDAVSVTTLRIGSASNGGPRYYAAPAMLANTMARNATPAVSAGTTEVSLSVTLEAQLAR